jgi:ankyrin repeat protein
MPNRRQNQIWTRKPVMTFQLSKGKVWMLIIFCVWNSVAFCANEIDTAAGTGNLEKVTALLKANPDLVFNKNEGNYTPLHVAALNGQNAIVKLLLASNADVNVKGATGDTPLNFAVRGNHLEIAKMLLAQKADVNAKNNWGYTPLRTAIDHGGSIDLLALLIASNADVNLKDNIGFTPLADATGTNVAKLLLANKADLNARDYSGGTPLQWAAYRGQKDVVEVLLAGNANIDARDNSGCTPLHTAVRRGKKDVVEVLLSHNADVNAKDNDGNTPLQFGFDNKEITALLRQHGGHGKENTTKPLAGWYCDGDTDAQHAPAIIEDYQAYAHKVWPKDHDFFISQVGFYENGAGKHAVRIELEPGLRYYVEYYLIYNTNDARIKVIKGKTWHQFSM